MAKKTRIKIKHEIASGNRKRMNLQRIYYIYRHKCSRERTGIELKNGLWKMKNKCHVYTHCTLINI